MHDTPQDEAKASEKQSGIRRAFVASLTGTALEWYDFAVYSAAAALVFGDLFFPRRTRSPAHSWRSPPTRSDTSPARSAGSSSVASAM